MSPQSPRKGFHPKPRSPPAKSLSQPELLPGVPSPLHPPHPCASLLQVCTPCSWTSYRNESRQSSPASHGARRSPAMEPRPLTAAAAAAPAWRWEPTMAGDGQAPGAGRVGQVHSRRQGMSGAHPALGSALFSLLLFGRAMRNPNITINAESILPPSLACTRSLGIQRPLPRSHSDGAGGARRQDRAQTRTDRHRCATSPPARSGRHLHQGDPRSLWGSCLAAQGASLLGPTLAGASWAAHGFPVGHHPLHSLSPSLKSLGLQGWIFLNLSLPSRQQGWTIPWGTAEQRPEVLTAPCPGWDPAGWAGPAPGLQPWSEPQPWLYAQTSCRKLLGRVTLG